VLLFAVRLNFCLCRFSGRILQKFIFKKCTECFELNILCKCSFCLRSIFPVKKQKRPTVITGGKLFLLTPFMLPVQENISNSVCVPVMYIMIYYFFLCLINSIKIYVLAHFFQFSYTCQRYTYSNKILIS